MPRNVRNFWIEVGIDGKTTLLEGGPVRADGGMSFTLYQREEGIPVEVMGVDCYRNADSETLITQIYPRGSRSLQVKTIR